MSADSAAIAVAKSPAPNPPYQVLTMTAAKKITNGEPLIGIQEPNPSISTSANETQKRATLYRSQRGRSGLSVGCVTKGARGGGEEA